MFEFTDFDSMREWIKTLPGTDTVRDYRLHVFDLLRYGQDYEEIYEFITGLREALQ